MGNAIMNKLEAEAMHDAEVAVQRAKMVETLFFGPFLQRARDQAAKIHQAAELCREVDDSECQLGGEK